MTRVAVVYHSDTGTTRLMAEAVRDGAASERNVEGQLHAIEARDIRDGRWSNSAILAAVGAAEAIVFGCPTYMGGVSAPMKAFLDASLHAWYQRAWLDKVAAGFTVSSTPSGDKLHALQGLVVTALQHGMIWVGQDRTVMNQEGLNRLGIYLGVGGQPDYNREQPALHAPDLETARLLGARVARIARALRHDRDPS